MRATGVDSDGAADSGEPIDGEGVDAGMVGDGDEGER